MTALNDWGDTPLFYTVAVGKGRDNAWVGAVDASASTTGSTTSRRRE